MHKYLTALLFAAASVAYAQTPVIGTGGIVNVASYTPAALPGSAIAQGSIFAIFGSGLGPASIQYATFPLSKTLAGTSIKVTSGGVTTDAYPLYTVAGQVAAILPSTVAAGSATLTLTYNSQTSAAASFVVATSAFGTFTVNSAGSGPGAILDASNNLNTLSNSFNPGDVAILYGTGLGAVADPSKEAAGPSPGNLSVPVKVFVGVQQLADANVQYHGRSGCCAGLDQINFVVPSVLGCHVPVAIQIGNNVSNLATMSVAPSGGRTCSDPGGPSASELQTYLTNGARVGAVSLSRISFDLGSIPGVGSVSSATDAGSATFFKYTPAILTSAQNPFQTSVIGACTVSYGTGSLSTTPVDPILPQALDAGPSISITGPNGTKTLPKVTNGGFSTYSATLGSSSPLPGAPSTLFLDPGAYTATGTGGADVGAFTASLTVPQPLVWTNEAAVTTITRSSGQQITWSGGDPGGTVILIGSSGSTVGTTTYTGTFICTAKVSDQQFTIPSVVLLTLPPSAVTAGVSSGVLLLGATGTPTSFTATGLDTGIFVSTVDAGKTLNYQ